MKASDYSILATSECFRDVVAFWRRQLDTPGDLIDALPAASAVADTATVRKTTNVVLGTRALSALETLANDDLGRFTVLAAGIALGIARYANRERVLLRSPLFRDDTAPTLNTAGEVPLVFAAADATTIRQFLNDAASVIEESYALQDFPIETLAHAEYGFDFSAHADVGVSSHAIHGASQLRQSALHFTIALNGAIGIQIDFAPDVVEGDVVEGLAAVITSTLDRFDDLSTTAHDIVRVPIDQRDRLLVEWNRTHTATPFCAAHTLFEERARATPDSIALRCDGNTLSYRALNERANQLAHRLIADRAQGPDALVGIWMDRSPWMVAAVLGVLKAGCAYVPIDADCPSDRLAFLIQDSGVQHLVIDERKSAAAATLACTAIIADREMPFATTNPSIEIAPTDLAYLLYTSGSTGQPKGCAIEHHSLTNYLRWANDFYWTSAGTGSMGLFTPLSFDLTVPSLFCPLLRGRTLTVFPQDALIHEVLTAQFTAGSGIDSVKLTPSHIRLLDAAHVATTDVRLVVVGGEALTSDQVATLHRIDPRIRVVNEYGPTEATVGCIVKDVASGDPITLGRPIANTQAYVLDSHQQLVPIGIPGELCIGGEGVARGYRGRPTLEAERFLPNPFVPGGRIYRTGDIARWLPQGELECFGRTDDQVKIRGYRIEPGEVEAALRRCDGTREAVVLAIDDALVAYVVSDRPVDAAALRETLGHSLPHYMVPAAFIGLTELPLTTNGKVDRSRLPHPSTVANTGRPYVAPRTNRERVLAAIWEELFQRDRIGIDDDFFALGGHSLRAMSLIQRIHQSLGLEVSLAEILSHPSIGALATLLQSRTATPTPHIPAIPDAEHYAVSHGQRRLWLIDRIEEASPAYNVSSAFDVRGPLDRDVLARAFHALITRHESLRTVFVEVNDEPRQRVRASLTLPIDYVDLRADADDESRLRSLMEIRASQPFDLATGPLLRVGVYQRDDERAVLTLTIHHIVSDAWSMRVLIADLVRLYEQHRAATETPLPPLAIQYRDYAAWQRHELASDAMRRDRDYWLAKLGGRLPVLDLPTDFPRPAVPSYRGRHHHEIIDADTAASLRALGAAHGASPFMTLVAITKVLLYRYTGQPDISVGSPIAGRIHPDLATQIGFYVNTLVLRDDVRGDEPFVTLLQRVKRTAEDAYTHQAFPFDRLVEDLEVARDLSRSPLVDVMVVHDSAADTPLPASVVSVEELRLDTGVSKFDLTFAFAESAAGIAIEIEYSTDLFTPQRIALMAERLRRLVRDVVLNADTLIGHFEIAGLDQPPPVIAPPQVLPASRVAAASHRPVAPRNDRELLLVGVLESVLGRAGIGVTDNFFHVGGDSIKAIQVVNRLQQHGWALRVRDLFEAPVIDALAVRMTPAAATRSRGAATGVVPLTPIQRWFFRTQPEGRAHFNQSVMLRFQQRLEPAVLHQIGKALVAEHDALRLRYRLDADQISQFYAESYDPVEVHDLRAEADPLAALARHAGIAQSSLDLVDGPLARFVLFQLPDDDRLLMIIHHLAVDGVSWRILLEDLRVGLAQASHGAPVHLAAASASYQAWSLALARHAKELTSEARWWQAVDTATRQVLPFDAPASDLLESESTEQRLTLTADDTRLLLSRVHQAYNTRTQDVLLAALGRAFAEWAGRGAVHVDLESHGRDGLDAMDGIDVSRTVGWLTSLYPIVLDIGDAQDPGTQLTTVKDALRQTPGHGLGYGALRDGAPSGADVLFNFLGQFDSDINELEIADDNRGVEVGPLTRMTHALVIGGWVSEGRLHMTIRYSSRQFHDATIARLMSAYQHALEQIIAHCASRVTHERTTSDFRYADSTTAALLRRLGPDRVEDVYPLSPMQLGMLYHSAIDEGAAVYVEQLAFTITGPLNPAAFRSAWERVIARHTALRTAFFWRDVEQPVQVVFSHAEAPWGAHDWRALPVDSRQSRLDAFAAQDRRKGFPLDSPPLIRFTLIRVSDDSHRFYWTTHHLILDGWSTAIVLQEVLADYQAAIAGIPLQLSPARPFGEYIDWLRSDTTAGADDDWRLRLHDFTAPTPLPAAVPATSHPGAFATKERSLSGEATARITDMTRTHALTLNTLMRGAWAMLLARHAGLDDVVFGATVAGRPAALNGVDTIVGLFINTLPVRVRIDAAASIVTWLHRLQIEQAQLDQQAFSALTDIQRASGVSTRTPLFESVFVFENYPVDPSLDPSTSDLVIDGPTAVEQTNYPLTLMVVPGEQLMLRFSYDSSRYDAETIEALLVEIQSTLDTISRAPDQTVGALRDDRATQPLTGPRHRFRISASTSADLSAIAARDGSSLDRVASALINELCARYAMNEDLRCAPDGTSPLDLSFTFITEPGPDLAVEVRSDSGRFGQAFLGRTESHLNTLIAAAARRPGEPLADLPVVPDDERMRLVDEFNRTDRTWGPDQTIVQFFETHAAAHSNRIAVRVPAIGRDDMRQDEVWTYGELNARANQLARMLVREHGVGPEVRVGVLAERSVGMVIALMAIEKAGGAYVPLDPDYPRDLLQFMIDDSGATVIVTEQRFLELIAGSRTPAVCLDLESARLEAESSNNLPSQVTGNSLAYVIYTSGSTGRPKGAMNTHRGIANRLLWMQDAYGLTEHDRVLQKTPFSFDVSVWEFFWPLMVGAELVVAKPGGHRDAAYLVSLIADTGITTLHFVPSMLQAFIEEPGLEGCRTLARVICSGEAVTPELLRRYLARIPVPLHNLYDPTEAAVDVTAWPCTSADTNAMVPIGRPIANIQLYILDPRLQPVPLGVTGELFLGGVGVGRGYLNRDALTAEKFIPDPFRPAANARLYRTGDLARYRDDGVVDFLGRIDHQVKLRGFRIELGEIESALLTHAAIRECVVVVREDQPGMKRLVAYMVLASGHSNLPADLTSHLRQTLASHMIPSVVVPLESLPRLTNGKIDRKGLPVPEEHVDLTRRHVMPRDAVERRMVRVWQDVLGQSMVGVTDDFFELGGHSILALRLMAAIQIEFGRSLPLAQLLSHSTIERLAVALKSDGTLQDWRPLVEIKRGQAGPPLFLLPGAGGNVVYFHTLAQLLTTTRPVYGLQAIGLDGRTPPLTTVESIASANIEEMRRVWPSGPYLLAGHSFGGRVAFEMAQQLQRQGQRVALVGVLDTAAPTFEPGEVGAGWSDAHWLAKIAREIEEFFDVRLDLTLDELLLLDREAQLVLVVERMQQAGAWAPGADRDQLRGYLEVYKTHSQAAYVSYDDTIARVPIALFKALERDADLEAVPAGLAALGTEHDWGWHQFSAGPVRVFEVPGAHLSMLMRPHVQALARALDDAIAASGISS